MKDIILVDRRDVLRAGLGLTAASLLATGASAQEGISVPPDSTKVLGATNSPLGSRSPFENPQRIIPGTPAPASASFTPLEALHGIITPADLHFERHHGGIPLIDPDRYELMIHGLVDRPMKFTLSDLKRFPAQSHLYFLECSGNGNSAARRPDDLPEEITPGRLDGLLSVSEWTGVKLSTILNEVGVRRSASWLLAEGQDAAVMTRSIPISKALDDAMIV